MIAFEFEDGTIMGTRACAQIDVGDAIDLNATTVITTACQKDIELIHYYLGLTVAKSTSLSAAASLSLSLPNLT